LLRDSLESPRPTAIVGRRCAKMMLVPVRLSGFLRLLLLLHLALLLSSCSSPFSHPPRFLVCAQQFSVGAGGCICSIAAVQQTINAVNQQNTQTHDDMKYGIPSLAQLQQLALSEVFRDGAGSSAGVEMHRLQQLLPQLQGGPITCNNYCLVNQEQSGGGDPLTWSSNTDFLTVSVGASGQVCGIHAAGPYLVECIGASDNSQLNVPPGLQALALSSGMYNTCALTLNHTLVCWGGLDTSDENDPPTQFTNGSMSQNTQRRAVMRRGRRGR
jgi:hypothetical protein